MGVTVHLPFGSLWDCFDQAAGIHHGGSRLQQHLMEGRLPEELLELLVTHLLQGLHAAVVQGVRTSAIKVSNMTFCCLVLSYTHLFSN